MDKAFMMCLECGNRFVKSLGRMVVEVRCPKCGGYDTDLDIAPMREVAKHLKLKVNGKRVGIGF